MKRKLLLLILFTTTTLFAQKLPRTLLNGQLAAESVSVSDVLITNKTAKTTSLSQNDGSFQILVREKDTLVFSGFNFPRQILVLKESDLSFTILKIQLESQAANLDEVVINRNALSGNIKQDIENIKITKIKTNIDNLAVTDQLFEDDLKSSPDNKLMPGYVDATYMMDFNKLGAKLLRSLKNKKPQKDADKTLNQFSLRMKNRFSKAFFRNNLNMNETQIEPFLNYCENDPKAQDLISKANDFELIQFLEQKKQAFLGLKKD